MARELNHERVTTKPVPTATAVVLGGAFVFPGGKVDPRLDTLPPQHFHPTLDELSQRLAGLGAL